MRFETPQFLSGQPGFVETAPEGFRASRYFKLNGWGFHPISACAVVVQTTHSESTRYQTSQDLSYWIESLDGHSLCATSAADGLHNLRGQAEAHILRHHLNFFDAVESV